MNHGMAEACWLLPTNHAVLATGQTIDSYRILGVLGQGGMGVVYRARHTVIDRQVALKVLSPQFARDQSVVERFSIEALAANRITHDNVIEVTDFVTSSSAGLSYMIMEYLEGESLEHVLDRQRRIDVDLAILVGYQVASAMAAAHRAGVIHRDLKPGNIFLCRQRGVPSIKVLDFGVSLVRGAGTEADASRYMVGTPLYMAPEQARGARADHRSDIYSLGAVLYHAISGTPVFDATTVSEIVRSHAYEAAPPLQSVIGADVQVPDRLAALIMTCLEKDPALRPGSMVELCTELAAIASERATEQMTDPFADASLEGGASRDLRSVDALELPVSRGVRVLRWTAGLAVVATLLTLAALGWHARSEPVKVAPGGAKGSVLTAVSMASFEGPARHRFLQPTCSAESSAPAPRVASRRGASGRGQSRRSGSLVPFTPRQRDAVLDPFVD